MNVFFGYGQDGVLVHKSAALYGAKLQYPLFARGDNQNLPDGMLYLLAQRIDYMGQSRKILFDGGNYNIDPW
ncbi:hypothetical protein D3C76_1663650 [compost metagenome]